MENKMSLIVIPVIRHPKGTWGLQRGDGKIMMKVVPQVGTRPVMNVIQFDTPEEAEEQRAILDPLTTEERQKRNVY